MGAQKKLLKRVLRYFLCPLGLSLAYWQYRRHIWKQNLLRNLQQSQNSNPLPLPTNFDIDNAEDDLSYQQKYRLDRILLGNCCQVGPKGIRVPENGPIQFRNALICAGLLENGKTLLLHLGWIPFRPDALQFTLSGKYLNNLLVSREADEKSSWLLANSPHLNKWVVKDIKELAQHLHTLPVMLRAKEAVHEDLFVQNYDWRNVPNRHLEYVFTWSALSATALVFSFLI